MLERKSEIKGTKGMKVKKRSEKWYWEDFKVYVPLCGKTANNQKITSHHVFSRNKKNVHWNYQKYLFKNKWSTLLDNVLK